MTALPSINDIYDEYELLDREDRYRLLIDLGKQLEPMPDALKTDASKRGSGNSGSEEQGGYGMTVQPLTPEIARELQLNGKREGVVITDVDPDGAAAAAGLQEGDVIKQVNGKTVTSTAELKSALEPSTDRPALLLVTRKGSDAFVTLSKPRS